MTAGIDEQLMTVLACPDDHHSPLTTGSENDSGSPVLACPECGREFPVEDGIPVLLPRAAD